jgi:hypothetical protein
LEAKYPTSVRITFMLSLLLIASAVSGQNLEIPKNEFALSFSKDQLELLRGEKGELEIVILKSKRYQKTKVKMGVSSIWLKGVTVTFSPEEGIFNSSLASVSIQPDATPGQYMLILNATLNNKTKGSILKLVIN